MTDTGYPEGSYADNECKLADMLDDDTLEYYETMIHTYDANYTAWALFNLLMMHKAAFLSMIDLHGNEPDYALQLRLQVQADANDGSGDYFQRRLDDIMTERKERRS